jgi:geranylgeranyl diphosphate synthase, type II
MRIKIEQRILYISGFYNRNQTERLDFIESYIPLIESELNNLGLPEKPETLYKPQNYILSSNAKRIRPILTLLGCGMSGAGIKDALPAAIAIEMVHNFTLIHDDIMDQAESRRGEPSIHVRWNVPAAILAGDGLFVQALLQLQRLPDSVNFKAISKEFLNGVNKVCEGQALDMEFEARTNVTVQEYLQMISGKTAALISSSLKIGGMVAGAPDKVLNELGVIGNSLGIAFQIQDDLLDVVADPEKFGKKKGGDISEGKKTFLMVKTLQSCTETEREWLMSLLQHRPISQKDVPDVIGLYEKYGVTNSAKTLMSDYYQKAHKTLNQFDDSDYKQDLEHLIHYLKKRDY